MLAETALTGLQRFEWRLLVPLLHSLVDAVLADFGAQEAEVCVHACVPVGQTAPRGRSGAVQLCLVMIATRRPCSTGLGTHFARIAAYCRSTSTALPSQTVVALQVEGPPRPPPAGFESVDALASRLHALLDGHEAAPFTLQRLCEVLLEPRRQYARLDKVVRRGGSWVRWDRAPAAGNLSAACWVGARDADVGSRQEHRACMVCKGMPPVNTCIYAQRTAAAAATDISGTCRGRFAAAFPNACALCYCPPGAGD